MKRIGLLTTVAVLLFTAKAFSQDAFNQNDVVHTYDGTKPSGDSLNPVVPNNGIMAKWIRSKKPTVTFNTDSYKPYIWNGMPFRVLYPKTYQQGVSDGKKYPVVVFWHGGGEIGPITDNEFQLYNGGEFFMQQVAAGNFDGFFIFPQEPTIGWENSFFSRINSVLDSMQKYCKVDADRVITMGLSIGGNGAFSYANLYPKRVSKIIASSPTKVGGVTPLIPTFLQIPVWMSSGGLDPDPDSTVAKQFNQSFLSAGGKIIYDYFPTRDHKTWYDQWSKPYFNAELNTAHKANPLVYFQKYQWCADTVINARLALTPGFYAYQWDKNGVIIPGETSAEYYATEIGTYRARFQRTATSGWSDWSPTPVVISKKLAFATPNIQILGTRSIVLPATDSSTTVPLTETSGFQQYRWVNASDNSILATTQVFNAPVGQFKATVMNATGCFGNYSPVFTTINANGPNKPDRAKSLSATAISVNSILLDWTKSSIVTNAPTGYEVYRALKAGGPYTLAGTVPATTLFFTDNGLLPSTTYFYVVRSINATAGGALSNEASAITQVDSIAPTAPSNLKSGKTTRQSVDLTWDAAADNVGVFKYDIYVNGVKTFTTDSTKFTVTNLAPKQPFVFVVKARDRSGNVSQPSNQVNASSALTGLSYRFYQGYWYSLPNFSNLTPVKTGTTPNVDISVRTAGVNDAFGFVWEGYIIIPTAGTYTFKLKSDDGSKLYINTFFDFSATPVVNNDGAHDNSQVKSGTYNFAQAGAYPICITFFEQGGGESIQVSYSGPGISETVIPNSAFADNVPPAGTVPAAPTALTATANTYSKITLSWGDNSNNESGFEIVRGVAAAGPFAPFATTVAGATSFADTTVAPLTAYYYKVRAVGTGGASAFAAVATATTPGLPAGPEAPSGLGLIVNSSKKITLNWTDNSGVEIGQEIYRSTNDVSNYKLIASVAPGVVNYADVNVFPSVTYYYKVRAKGSNNFSAYSNEAFAKTLNTKPAITLVPDFTMRYGTQVIQAISATDSDNDDLTFTSGNLPAFATFVTTSNGAGNLTFAPSVANQGSYTITTYVADGNGGRDTMRFNLVVNNNYPPVITSVNNISVNEGSTTNVNVTANDNEGNAYIGWSFTNLPSFATFTNNGNGNGTIALTPGYTASGDYNVKVLVDDGFGGSANKDFTITVKEKSPGQNWQINIKTANNAPAPWNNVGLSANGLLNTAGQATSVNINSTPTWMSFNTTGAVTGNNSGYYPDVVLRDNMYLPSGIDTGTVNIKGLNTAKTYNFRFLSSCNNASEVATARTGFRIGTKYDSVLIKNNTSKTAYMSGISPDALGNVVIRFYKSSGALTGYLNAIEVEEAFNDGTAPVKAQNMAATFISGTGAKLTWKDIAYNESSYKVYRASTQAGPYTQLNPGAVNPNDTSYVDATTAASSTYYYYVIASNSVGNSPASDTVALVTGNNPPSISAISDLYVKAGASTSVNFTVSDDPSDVLTVTSASLPTSFVSLQPAGAGSFNIVANPTIDNVGFYIASINVKDDKGQVTTKAFNILVSDNKVKTALVKFGGDGFVLPKPWNNISSSYPTSGLKVLNMVDDSKAATTWGVQLTTNFDGFFINGFKTGNNEGVVPDTVLYSGMYVSSSSTARTFKLTGLDNNKTYSIGFVSSSNSGYNSGITVSSGAQSFTSNGSYNATLLPRLNGLTPVAGEIAVSVLKTAISVNAYINALIIQEYDAAVTPYLSPSNLIAEPFTRNKIALNWSDRTGNETGFEVYRSTTYGSGYTKINTTPIATNVTTFTDSTAMADTRYYYKVRAVNGGSSSDYSNVASTTTFINSEYVNMTSKPGGTTGLWNNTGKVPAVGDVFPLKDDMGNLTSYTLSIVNNFSGSNLFGASTGRNAGVFPDSVLTSNYTIAKGTIATVTFKNLDQSKRYRVGFAGSSNVYNNYNTTYSISNRTVYLNALYDTIKAVYIDNVLPNSNGEITVNISCTAEAASGLISALVLQGYTYVPGGPVVSNNPITSTVVKADLPKVSEAKKDTSLAVAAVINAYPNPFTDNLSLDITSVSTIEKLEVEIYNSNGKLMYQKLYNTLPSGRNTIRVSTMDVKLPQGIYFMRLHSNDGSTNNIIKLIKVIK